MFKDSVIPRWVVFLGILLALSCPSVFGQVQTSEILGVVTDPSGASVAGAAVRITDVDTGLPRDVKTDDQGRYDASNLEIGNYQVEVQMQGFAGQVQKGITVSVGQKTVVDFKLQVGAVTQEVTVTSDVAAQINTTTSEVGGLVDTTQMEELPLNGRNYEQLFSLVPGIATLPTNSGGPNFGNSTRFSVAGARVDAGSVLLDGMEIRTFWGSGGGLAIIGTSLGVDGIAEFQAMTSNFTAQYSGASVLNEVTRSGTNSLHGSAYGFFRNSAMDSRAYFDPATGPAPYHRNQFGGTIGGPIKKNKTFFFVNYEGFRSSLAEEFAVNSPDANAHNGFLPCAQAKDFACNMTTGLADVGVNPLVAPILALYPTFTPNASGTIFEQAANGTTQSTIEAQQPETENYLATKVDHQINANNNIAFRYVIDQGTLIAPWPNGADYLTYYIDPNIESDPERNQYFTVQDRQIFSASLVNVATLSFVRTNQYDTDNLSKAPPVMTFIAGRPMGDLVVANLTILGIAGYLPVKWTQNDFSGGDEIDWVHGAHTLKFGGGVTRIQCNCTQVTTPGGLFNFAASGSGGAPYSGLEAFLEDEPINVQAQIQGGLIPQRNARQTNVSGFVQDDWKVRKNLTLNLGLRYDFTNNPTEAAGLLYRITNIYPTILNDPNELHNYVHEPHYFAHNPSLKNVDPRVGFAWDIFPDHKTSLRAGFGMFHAVIYPRDYVVGGSVAYPQVAGIEVDPSFPVLNLASVGLAPIIARSQTAYYYSTPYMIEYNATVERQLPWGLTGSLGYVGSSGVHLVVNEEGNTNIPEILADGQQYRPPCGSIPANTSWGCTPDPFFGPIEQRTPEGNSHYNSIILSAKRNLGKGIQIQSGLTLARSIDWGSSSISTVDVTNDSTIGVYPNISKAYNKGRSAFDVGKSWVSNLLVPLPFHGNQFKEGWQLSGIFTMRTGMPQTPQIGVSSTGAFDRGNFGQDYYLEQRPEINPNFTGPLIVGKVKEWYNPAAFTLPAVGFIGNEPRMLITAPGLSDMDVSLMKSTRIPKGESTYLEIRAEAFNSLNHANFGFSNISAYTSTTPNALAGNISTTITAGRQLQFSAKLLF